MKISSFAVLAAIQLLHVSPTEAADKPLSLMCEVRDYRILFPLEATESTLEKNVKKRVGETREIIIIDSKLTYRMDGSTLIEAGSPGEVTPASVWQAEWNLSPTKLLVTLSVPNRPKRYMDTLSVDRYTGHMEETEFSEDNYSFTLIGRCKASSERLF